MLGKNNVLIAITQYFLHAKLDILCKNIFTRNLNSLDGVHIE